MAIHAEKSKEDEIHNGANNLHQADDGCNKPDLRHAYLLRRASTDRCTKATATIRM